MSAADEHSGIEFFGRPPDDTWSLLYFRKFIVATYSIVHRELDADLDAA